MRRSVLGEAVYRDPKLVVGVIVFLRGRCCLYFSGVVFLYLILDSWHEALGFSGFLGSALVMPAVWHGLTQRLPSHYTVPYDQVRMTNLITASITLNLNEIH